MHGPLNVKYINPFCVIMFILKCKAMLICCYAANCHEFIYDSYSLCDNSWLARACSRSRLHNDTQTHTLGMTPLDE